jgi:hypothetical protein
MGYQPHLTDADQRDLSPQSTNDDVHSNKMEGSQGILIRLCYMVPDAYDSSMLLARCLLKL